MMFYNYRDMLKLGSSREWPDALEAITGKRSMSVQPLISYFQPLINWLQDYNMRMGWNTTWTDECPTDLPEVRIQSNYWLIVI